MIMEMVPANRHFHDHGHGRWASALIAVMAPGMTVPGFFIRACIARS
jgi:hypothetical protein